MKKVGIAVILILIIAITISSVFVNKLDGIIAETIRTQGSEILGSKVGVESVETSLKEGNATITGLTIANPSDYQTEHALTINSFVAEVDYRNQVIDKIIIEQPKINAEVIDVNKNNFQDLLDAMPAKNDIDLGENNDSDFEITIKELQFNQAMVNLLNKELGTHSFVMSNLVITNLHGTVDLISSEIVSQLTKHVSNQVSDYVKKELTELAKDKAKQEVKEAINEKIDDGLKNKLKSLNLEIR